MSIWHYVLLLSVGFAAVALSTLVIFIAAEMEW